MEHDSEDFQEFKSEAEDLLQSAEDHLLKMEVEGDYKLHYEAVFRSLHSLKGASGMLRLEDLRVHVHKLENIFTSYKEGPVLSREMVTFFLEGVDATRSILNNKPFSFDYQPGVPKKKGEDKANSNRTYQKLIFIIDDEEDNLEIIQSMLPSGKYQTKTFTSPELALRSCVETPPDLVLTDMKMPVYSGLDILKRIKDIDSHIPVIFISGHLDKETLISALNIGVYAILEKPVKEVILMSHVTQALKKKEMWKLLNSSINLILFQLNDMEKYLISQGKTELVQIMKQDTRQLLEARRALKAT